MNGNTSSQSARWYCKRSGKVSGPFSLEEIRLLRDRGKLESEDEVRDGMSSSWTPVCSLAVLVPNDRESIEQTLSAKTAHATIVPRTPPTVVRIGDKPRSTPSLERSQSRVIRQGGPPPPPFRRDRGAETRKRVLLRVAIAAGTVILVLLFLLLLLRAVEIGRGQGSGQGHDVGDGSGGGMGKESASGVGSGSSRRAGDAPENDAPSSNDAEVRDTTKKNDSSPVTPANSRSTKSPPKKEPPPAGLFEISRLLPPAPSTPTGPATGEAGSAGRGNGNLGEFRQRLERERAKTGDVQVSLLWNNFNDLDLHIVCPSGEPIFFSHRRSACGGELDVDMNAGGPTSNTPVENIYWPHGGAPNGNFSIYVHYYANHGGVDPTRFRVAVKVGSRTHTFSGSVSRGDPPKLIYTFKR